MPHVYAEHKDWMLCRGCGELQKIVAVSTEHEMVCWNCNKLLHRGHGNWLQSASALVFTAFILFLISQFFPFLTLEIGSQSHTTTVIDGFWALMERDSWLLASLIITTTFLFPLLEILAFLYLLIPYSLNRRVPGQAAVLRWLMVAKAWSMLEVFLLSVVISAVKMADLAVLHLGLGFYALLLLVGVLLIMHLTMDRRKLWSWISTNNYFTVHEGETVYDCRICQAMVGESIVENEQRCPRCCSEIHKRVPKSMQKTLALIVAATILYVPANILPIMTFSTLGDVSTNTIISGVVELVVDGLYGIATIVFVASVLVPILKLVVLYYLVWSVYARWQIGAKHRAILYRVIEVVGRWSMVDVFVVTVFVALVQFGFVYTVELEGAIIAFGAVVMLTMIAAETFDSRLIWDARNAQIQKEREQVESKQVAMSQQANPLK